MKKPVSQKKFGADKNASGEFTDTRKSALFHISESEIDTKTSLDGLRNTVFMDRYSMRDKDGASLENFPEQMWLRVARGIAQFEKEDARGEWERKFYNVMRDFKFVPGGRILSGAGTGYEVTFFNCYVIPSPKDSRGGIMENITQTVEIQSRAGGVGVNLSSLRPRGARVRKVNGTSSGPVNWAALYSTANHDVIQQGGSRRGALMLMLNDWHPDLKEFIKVKEDLTKIPGANLSVCVSDEFMDAVKNDKTWDLVFPDFSAEPDYDEVWDGDIEKWKAEGRKVIVYETVKAKEIWDMIAQAAWRSAEPGLHFIGRSNKRSNTYYFEKLIATNPSLRKGTRVLTKAGIFPIEQLDGEKFFVKNLNGKWSKAECFLSGNDKELYKITLNNGHEIYATAEHKWPILAVGGGFGKVATSDLKAGNILPFPQASDIDIDSMNPLSKKEGFMVGWLYGDGWISDRGSGRSKEPDYSYSMADGLMSISSAHSSKLENERIFGFLFSEEEKYLSKQVLPEINKLKKVPSELKRAYGNTYTIQATSKEFAKALFTKFGVDKKEFGLPSSVWSSGSEYAKGVVDGLFSSDGFVSKNSRRIIYTTKHTKLASDISSLLSFYGIKSTIRRSESGMVKFPNQKDYSKTYVRYDVTIDGFHAVNFSKLFTLSHKRKQKNLDQISTYVSSRKSPDDGLMRITSVEKTELKEDVWDIRVYDDTHCFYIDHCITGNCGEQPLGAWAVCNLGAMNLSAYVNSDSEFEYEQLADDVQVAMRFMDNVCDANFYFYPQTYEMQMDIRRTGLGTMGLGDALIKMQIPYGSDESVKVIEKIYKTIRDNAYFASSEISGEKGTFRKYDKEKYLDGYFIKKLPKYIRENIAKKGIRNAVLLTQAPTGTTSLLSGVSSGIEPVYNFEFKRKDRTGEHIVYHPLFEEWKKQNPDAEKPNYFVCAMDLSPEEHLKVQAKIQEYTDSSISKTVNAPNEYTVEDVKRLYTLAYEMGCKGITFFRDGSRAGVLESIKEEKKEEKEVEKPAVTTDYIIDRPFMVRGSTYKMNTPAGKAFITIDEDEEGEPLEVFINVGKAGSDIAAIAEAMGRMISTTFRMRGSISAKKRALEISEQLSGIGGRRSVGFGSNRIMSLPDAIGIALATHYGFRQNLNLPTSNGVAANGGNGAYTNGHTTNTEVKQSLFAQEEAPIATTQIMTSAPMQAEVPAGKQKADLCPECGSHSLIFEEGCAKCYSCGHSEC